MFTSILSERLLFASRSGGEIYKPGQILFESSTPGTYTLNLEQESGVYEVITVGAGGGGYGPICPWTMACAGCSGAAFIGQFQINSTILSISIGAGGAYRTFDYTASSWDSNTGNKGGNTSVYDPFNDYVTSEGGNRGYWVAQMSSAAQREVSKNTYYNALSVSLNKNGVFGPQNEYYSAAGGASQYGGYGAGGSATGTGGRPGIGSGTAGGSGYCKVTYMNLVENS